jgi:hypothetical protein
MKECIKEAYDYYHNPLFKECEKELKGVPLFFGRKKEKAIREKYRQKGLKVIRYEDIRNPYDLPELNREARGGYKPCATFVGYGHYVCGIDNSSVEGCECCKTNEECRKLQDFLWSDLYD